MSFSRIMKRLFGIETVEIAIEEQSGINNCLKTNQNFSEVSHPEDHQAFMISQPKDRPTDVVKEQVLIANKPKDRITEVVKKPVSGSKKLKGKPTRIFKKLVRSSFIKPTDQYDLNQQGLFLYDISDVSKSYISGDGSELVVLDSICLQILRGKITGLVGTSGCGKSTLMHLLGTTDFVDSGDVWYREKDWVNLDFENNELIDKFRRYHVSWVFQDNNLISHLNVVKNVMMPLQLRGVNYFSARKIALKSLNEVGIEEKSKSKIGNLSGGERQRVAIARAIASNAKVILADEPTGSLDGVTGRKVLEIFKEINRKRGTSIVLVTHDIRLANDYCDRIINLEKLKQNPPLNGIYVGDKPTPKH